MSLSDADVLSLAWSQLWQLTGLIVVVAWFVRLCCARQAHFAYLLWVLVLAKALTPPVLSSPAGIFSWIQLQTKSPATTDVVDASTMLPPGAPATEGTGNDVQYSTWNAVSTHTAPAPKVSVSSTILVLWLTGTTAFAIVGVAAWGRLRWQLLRSRRPADPVIEALVSKLTRQLRIRRPVRLVVTSEPIGPATFGFLCPHIVIPHTLLTQHSSPTIELILAHELIHIRRWDALLGVGQFLSQLVWWFHPLVWWANRQASRECERCCDQEVVAELGCSPAIYARCLVDVLTSKRRPRPVFGFHGIHPAQVTSKRLEEIMKRAHTFQRHTPLWCWAFIVVGAVLLLPGAALTIQRTAAPASDENEATSNDRDEIVAAIENLGGDVEVDDNLPDRPITGVMLGRTEFANEDLRHLRGLTSLRALNLGWTPVGDEGLAHLQALTDLRNLYLESCENVTDEGLAHLQRLSHLTRLTISHTGVTDAGMEHLKDLTALEILDLTGLPITDEGAEHLHGLKNLRVLFFCRRGDDDLRTPLVSIEAVQRLRASLPNCDIVHEPPIDRNVTEAFMQLKDEERTLERQARNDRIRRLVNQGLTVRNIEEAVDAVQQLPAAIGKLANGFSEVERRADRMNGPRSIVDLDKFHRGDKVVFVDLGNAPINDAFVAHLRFMTDLELLDLRRTPITDTALAHLRPLENLRSLQVQGTSVGDGGLAHLAGLTRLEELILADTRVTDAGLVHLKGLTKLDHLSLAGTAVTDSGLQQLRNLTKLESIGLDGTDVTDAGLVHLRGLTKLRWVGLRETKVTDAGGDDLKDALPSATIRHRGPWR